MRKYVSRTEEESSITPRKTEVLWGSNPDNEAQVFAKNGFLMKRKLFSLDEVEQINKEINSRWPVELTKETKVTEDQVIATEKDSNVIRTVFSFHKTDGILNDIACEKRLNEFVTKVLDSDVYIHQSRINFQRPFKGSGFYWHSDFETWHVEDGMPEMRAISAVIMLEPNKHYNGALMVIPKSHNSFISCVGETPKKHWEISLRQQNYGIPSQESIDKFANEFGIEYCTGEPGDVLFFDCNLLHGSHSNISPFGRRNLFIVFNSVENRLHQTDLQRPEHIASRDKFWTQKIIPKNL
eukprot:gene10984-3690_t